MLRKTLIINHVEREILCNPDESLAQVVRRMGLTGTKVGCGTGQCGSCSLIFNGKLIRSCVRLMKSVKDYAEVETIEGLGTPENLHPLQQAFLTYAAVQCGFCSPGFIMSAKALLNENLSPSRQEVRDWFTKHNNICRCTGYKPIIDAVMAAAEVMRGEKTMADITFTPDEDGTIYGTHFPKPEGAARVLGQCDYGSDVALKMPENALHLAVVLARTHRARITNIAMDEALAMDGVVKVITAKDVKGTNRLFSPQASVHSACKGYERPVINEDLIYRFGDIVAVVAAKTKAQARLAAAKVVVEYEELPPVMTFLDAAKADAPQVHADMPNIFIEQPVLKGEDPRPIVEGAHCVAEGSFSTSRQSHLPIEPDVVQAYPQDDGIVIQCKTQYLYFIKAQISEAVGLDKDKIHIISNPAGGSFGYSMSPANYALCTICALALNAPVSLELSYEEHQHVTGKRSPVHANVRLACDESGKMLGMDFLAGADHGAYSEMAGALTTKIIRFFGYPYSIASVRGLVRTAYTNANFGIAYRAFGSPQSYTASEQIVDILAKKMGMDPFEFRYINVAQKGDLSTTSVPYFEYPMKGIMDMMRPHYEEAKKNAAEKTTDTVKYGVGISWGGYHVSKTPDRAESDIELTSDNSVTVYNTWANVGQGADFGTLAHTHEALRPLGIPHQNIKLVQGNTQTCPDSGSAAGSRSHHASGKAILNAAAQLMDAMRKEDGTFRTFAEMKAENLPLRFHGVYTDSIADIDPDTGHGYGSVAQNYMLFLTEVAVNTETGKVSVESARVIADVGTIGSYHAVLGQAWGGFSHSVGFALSEQYDDMQKHASMRGAGIPKCNDIPDTFHVDFHVTERPNGPQGSTGCAEGFQSSGHVAIMNAIANAVDLRFNALPVTPEKIKAGLQGQQNSKDAITEPWDLGCDLYERLAFLQEKAQQ